MKLYSIKDAKAQSFGGVFVFPTDGLACRSIGAYAKRDETISAYPVDFDVYSLGVYDQATGAISPEVVFVAHVGDCINAKID